MITKFNHVAIVVPDLNAAKKYKEVLGAMFLKFAIIEHGVSVVFIELENTKIELILMEKKTLQKG
ncbi:MAG: hypothetical protein CM15mP40_11380 [Alphaproteobacteria bacterium]|nr:MAG: hypothetical protein CM15mP40_11380 [Alphaproteobacteria bacterium]